MRISTNMFHSQGVKSIQSHQEDILKAQLQLSTGKRINAPSDDPVGAVQVHSLNKMMNSIDQFAMNGQYAKIQLNQEETAVGDVINAVQRARELSIQAKNGSYNATDRKAIAAEIGQLIQQVTSSMNYTNSDGEKLFAGSNVTAKNAFVDDVVNPGYKAYIGNPNSGSAAAADARFSASDDYDPLANYGSRFIQVAFDSDNQLAPDDLGDPSRVRVTDNGAKVFGIPNGESVFKTAKPFMKEVLNKGEVEQANVKFYPMTEGQSITIAGLTYTANSAMTEGQVAAAFENLADGVTTGSGTATGTYTGTLTNWSSGAVQDGNFVDFQTTIGAADENVANLTVSSTDVYLPEHNIANVLIELKRDLENNDTSGIAAYVKDFDKSISQMSDVRAEIGGRLNRIESQYESGEAFKVSLEARRSVLEDTDVVKGITELTKSQNALQMAQQVFTKVQSSSLFNYIR